MYATFADFDLIHTLNISRTEQNQEEHIAEAEMWQSLFCSASSSD